MQPFTRLPQRLGTPLAVRACLLAGAALGAAQARAIDWGNTNGGTFSVGANWIGGVVPGTGDFARFSRTRNVNSPATYTVSLSTNPSNLNFSTFDHVTFDLNGHTYLLTQSNAAIGVGAALGGIGSLTITDGVVATTHATASASVGFGSGSASLTISTGGQLLGPALSVGNSSHGSLAIQNGGDFVGRSMTVGVDAGVTGAATITGAGSTAVVEQLHVGYNGTGTLNINSGGRVESTSGFVGTFDSSVGTATVDGTNSRWTSSGGMYAGFEGRGTLNITGGGRVQSTLGVVGSDSISTGTVAVVGAGSQWINSSDMIVGESGTATLDVSAGGEVRSARGFIAQYAGLGSASVSGAGAMWNMTGTLSVGGDIGQGIAGGSATLLVGPGGTVSADFLFIFPGDAVVLQGGTLDIFRISHAFDSTGQLSFQSGTLHVGQVEFSLLNQGGTLAPGHSAGNTNILGNYTQQAAATMEIEIGGTIPDTQFDRISVGGQASLAGALDLRLISGFVPNPAQTFVVLDAAGISGAFANVASGQRRAISNASGSFVVHYGPGSPFDPTTIVLSDFGTCPADFDGDGFVSGIDFDLYVAAFEEGALSADFDGDGFITGIDFDLYVVAFEAGC